MSGIVWRARSFLDTRRYIVEFPDRQVSTFMANLITENMYTQCDIDF